MSLRARCFFFQHKAPPLPALFYTQHRYSCHCFFCSSSLSLKSSSLESVCYKTRLSTDMPSGVSTLSSASSYTLMWPRRTSFPRIHSFLYIFSALSVLRTEITEMISGNTLAPDYNPQPAALRVLLYCCVVLISMRELGVFCTFEWLNLTSLAVSSRPGGTGSRSVQTVAPEKVHVSAKYGLFTAL